MKLYVFERLADVSENYHPGGGLVIVARDEAQARALLKAAQRDAEMQRAKEDEPPEVASPSVTDREWETARIFELAGDTSPQLFVFPNAGCC